MTELNKVLSNDILEVLPEDGEGDLLDIITKN